MWGRKIEKNNGERQQRLGRIHLTREGSLDLKSGSVERLYRRTRRVAVVQLGPDCDDFRLSALAITQPGGTWTDPMADDPLHPPAKSV